MTRFNEQDPFGIFGTNPNLYAYAGNNTTNAIDPSGLCQKAICEISKISILEKAADIPAATKDWFKDIDGKVVGEAKLSASFLGPYNDPKKTGYFNNVQWVYAQGKNIGDCIEQRFVSVTQVTGKEKIERGGGFQGAGKKAGKNAFNDFPRVGVLNSLTNDFVVIADGPGTKRSLKADEYPYSFEANFYVYIESDSDKKVKAQIWYDVIIKASGPGKATVNKVAITEKKPG